MPSSSLIQSVKARPDRVESFLDLVSFFSPSVQSLHSQNDEKNPSSSLIQSTKAQILFESILIWYFFFLFRSHCSLFRQMKNIYIYRNRR
ncbi:hypothetical protein LguiA_015191 [Lonicera macranthoides]